jgi:nitrogen PTS system EIIA component
MKCLLDALQEGRLIELPSADKETALRFLATLIEAITDLKAGTDVAEAVLARERSANTAIGRGWACPHVRVPGEGEMRCAVGWSPAGIDYGATDHVAVHLVSLYFIPDNQKNAYLKEISTLARVVQAGRGFAAFEKAKDLAEVRITLLDALSTALESGIPEVKARMIRLEARHAEARAEAGAHALRVPLDVIPLSVVLVPGRAPLVLAPHRDTVARLEAAGEALGALARQSQVDCAGYRLLSYAVTAYPPDRAVYQCVAIRPDAPPRAAGA